MIEKKLEIKNLSAYIIHQSKEILTDINLEIFDGEIFALVGESGSGKTTLINTILGVLNESDWRFSGSIKFGEDYILKRQEHKNKINPKTIETKNTNDLMTNHLTSNDNTPSLYNHQYLDTIRGHSISAIFQEPTSYLNPSLTIEYQLIESLKVSQGIDSNPEQTILKILDEVQIDNGSAILKKYPHELSTGQKQRILIAMALISNSPLILADEPTSALDVTIQKEILQLLKELKSTNKIKSLFIVTHDIGIVNEIGVDKVAVMRNGKLLEQAKSLNELEKSQNDYVVKLINDAKFLGGFSSNKEKIKGEIRNIHSEESILQIKDLSQSYYKRGIFTIKENLVIKDVSLDLMRGEFLGIVGESGCGKTTLAKSIIGMLQNTKGKIILNGKDLLENKRTRIPRSPQIQMIFQDSDSIFNPSMTVKEIINETISIFSPTLKSKDRYKKILDTLLSVGLKESILNQYPYSLSGGEKQRLAIARALLSNPKIIIADEPFSRLDVVIRNEIIDLINSFRDRISFIIISHDLHIVSKLCDRIAVMYDGKILEIDTPKNLFECPKNEYTKRLIDAIPKFYRIPHFI